MRRRRARRASSAEPVTSRTVRSRGVRRRGMVRRLRSGSGRRLRGGGAGQIGDRLRGAALLGGVVGAAEVARDGLHHGARGGQDAPLPALVELLERRLAVEHRGVVLHEEARPALPQEHQRRERERPGPHPAPVSAVDVLEQLEGDRAVLDLLRSVPAQQVQHRGVRALAVQLVRVEHPVAEERRVVLDRGDERDPLHQPPLARPPRRQRPVTEQLLEEPVDLSGVRGRVEPLLLEVRQHLVVSLRVHGLLADEPDHVLAEPVVADVRQDLLVDVHEPPLSGGQQEMQHVDRVRGERVVRYPVQRCPVPGEGDPACLERDALVSDGPRCPALRIRHGVNVLTGRGRVQPSCTLFFTDVSARGDPGRRAFSAGRPPRGPSPCGRSASSWLPAGSARPGRCPWRGRRPTTRST